MVAYYYYVTLTYIPELLLTVHFVVRKKFYLLDYASQKKD